MALVVPDISEYQVAVNGKYPRDFLIFRATDGDAYLDKKFLTNANQVAALYKAKKIAGAICYGVYRPVAVQAQYDWFWKAIGPKVPVWLKGVMIDVESWGGQITGNRSAAINQLAGMHAEKMGSWNSVIAYGNRNDLATIYPQRDARIRLIVASYGSKLVTSAYPKAIGQQYTDGNALYGVPEGLPIATAPFGKCDHNIFPGVETGAELAALLAAPKPVVKAAPKPAPKPVVKAAPKPAPKPVAKPPAKAPVVVAPAPTPPVAVVVPAPVVVAPVVATPAPDVSPVAEPVAVEGAAPATGAASPVAPSPVVSKAPKESFMAKLAAVRKLLVFVLGLAGAVVSTGLLHGDTANIVNSVLAVLTGAGIYLAPNQKPVATSDTDK